MRHPTIPRSKSNPVGQTRLIRKATRLLRKDLRDARDMVQAEVAKWPYTVKNAWTSNAFYEFLVDGNVIKALVQSLANLLGSGPGAEALRRATEAAYKQGVARAVDNLRGLSDDYPRTVLQRLGDLLVLRRAALAGSRVFEEMQGFAGDTAADLGRVLFEAVQSGENPRETAKRLRARFGVGRTRAERIARTEITMAHRRGRWDEARDTEERFGIKTMLLHNSAMIAGRTRRTHAARHGKLFTRDETAAWYSSDGNAINCLCSQTEVTVDKDGKPIFGKKLIERMGQQRAKYLAATPTEGAMA